jgi:hypothetical protein
MSRNWENRPDQVELMLHYPESALRVVPLMASSISPSAHARAENQIAMG